MAFNPALTVATVDDSGKVVSSSTVITLVLDGGSGNGSFVGAPIATSVNGVAVFPGLSVSAAGSAYTFTASAAGLKNATSNPFEITAVEAAAPVIQLSLPTQSINAGLTMTGKLTLSKPAGAGGVTVQLNTGSAGIMMVTPSTLSIVAGQSSGTFLCSALSAGSTSLIASAAGGNTVTTTVSVIAPAPATPPVAPPAVFTHLLFSMQPGSVLVGASLNPPPTVSVVDSSGNLVTNANLQITLGLTTSSGASAALNGTTTLQVSNGLAVFSGVSIPNANTGYRLLASSPSLASTTSTSFDVTAPAATSSIPASATVSNNLEASQNWHWNHDPGTPGASVGTSSFGISTPSMNGASRVYSLTYSGHGGEIYHLSFGLDTIATHFVYESYIYITDPSQIQNIEMDMNHVMANGQTVILGTQCAAGSQTWEFTKVANGGTHWYASNIPCNPRSLSANTWHHIQIASHHDSNGYATYDWVSVDGKQTNFVNAAGPSVLSLGWQRGDLLINFQLDGYNKTSGAITVYTEKMAMYRW